MPLNQHTFFAFRLRELQINKLMEEFSTQAIAEFDAETRFRSMAARGSVKKGLKVLEKLDRSLAD